MKKSIMCMMFVVFLFSAALCQSQEIREYTVKRTAGKMVIDGKLDEPEWKHAAFTEEFVVYTDGTAPRFPAQGQMLWDDTYLYIAFTMTDEDVWGEMTFWTPKDPCLCLEEVAEIFIDPDDDRQNYIEVEINPLGTVMDLIVAKAFKDGGSANLEWKFEGIKVGIGVDGTLNDKSDKDTKWICEVGLPFTTMAPSATSRAFPPENGDSWRINLYRYDYDRTEKWHNELTGWNQTGTTGGFHVPERFGRIFFSTDTVIKSPVKKPQG